MRILDFYLLRELLARLGYSFTGLLVFWISSDLINQIEEFQKRKLVFRDVVDFYLVALPEILVTVMPIILLLALLWALTHHARHNELTAMRAAGLSLWRVALPYLLVGVSFSAGLFVLNEFYVPEAEPATRAILNRRLGGPAEAAQGYWKKDFYFRNHRDNRTWRIGAYNTETCEMISPSVDWRLPNGSRREIYAERGVRSNACWVFLNVSQLIHPAPADPTNTGPISPNLILRSQTNVLVLDELSETPEQIRSEIKIRGLDSIRASKRPQLSIRTIVDYLSLNPHPLPDLKAKLETQLHVRLAAPWTCIVVVLIALPFGAASGRRNVFVGVASSIFICFAYFVLQRVGLALGVGGFIPGWLAGWLPNLVFGVAGIWLTSNVR